MINKEDFIRSFLPEEVKDVQFVQIDLDITNLSIPDILRNINKTFPKNSRERNRIMSGEKVISILCKSKTITPYNGIILMVCGGETDIAIVSRKYIVMGIGEDKITDETIMNETINKISLFMAKVYKDSMPSFHDFYVKYLYNDYEMYEDDDYYE